MGKKFKSTRGLRQGDPLSPFLFTIVMEGFCRMLAAVETRGAIKGLTVTKQGTTLSHLLFADDTLVFSADKEEYIHNIKGLLMCFELSTGLRINMSKSTAIGVGDFQHMHAVRSSLGYTFEEIPFRYLGMPAGTNYRCKKIWDPFLESIDKRLAGWKRIYLSYGGRVVLIKSVLCSLAIYLMSCFSIPPDVAKKIERKMRTFLWGI